MNRIAFIIFIGLLLASRSVSAQVDTTATDKKTLEVLENLISSISKNKTAVNDELGGQVMLDQTKSRAGKDFFDLFSQSLDIPSNVVSYNILVDEKPSLGTSTIISVYINDIEVYSNYLQPKLDNIEETAKEAIDLATDFITNYNQIILELSSQEQLGTGIF